jgi:hypothetical protein
MDQHGISERIHANTKRMPANACTPSQIENLIAFIDNIADSHAMPLPGCMPNFREDRLLLPTDMMKARVYEMYKKSGEDNGEEIVGDQNFIVFGMKLDPSLSL